MTELIITSIVAPLLLLIGQHLVARRKKRAEAESIEADTNAKELDNAQEAIAIYKSLAEDFAAKLKDSDAINEELREGMRKISEQYTKLESNYKTLLQNHKDVVSKLDALRKDYDALSRKYEELKSK